MSPTSDLPDTPSPLPVDEAARRGLRRHRGGLQFGLLLAGVAVAIGVLLPHATVAALMRESGPVERATLWLYMAAVLALLLGGRSLLRPLDLTAGCVLLLAMAAREADLHSALFGISILKSRFYLDAPLRQILVALAILLPIAASGLWLLWRYGPRWAVSPRRWTPPMVTLAAMAGAMVFAKIMDRTPATLGELGRLQYTPQMLVAIMLALEEVLELGLPLFAILALLQARAAAPAARLRM